ncbi:PulJ/GspJ family protein [Hydrogenimonas sp.]
MRRRPGFTLVEMLVSILLTAMVFTYLYGTLDSVRKSHTRYTRSVQKVTNAQTVYGLILRDISQVRGPVKIVHEGGFDHIAFTTDHSIYGMARPWVHYYVSRNEEALIRIEATTAIDFFGSNYIGDGKGTYFFADRLATGCTSLRFSRSGSRIYALVKCSDATPIVSVLYKGDR